MVMFLIRSETSVGQPAIVVTSSKTEKCNVAFPDLRILVLMFSVVAFSIIFHQKSLSKFHKWHSARHKVMLHNTGQLIDNEIHQWTKCWMKFISQPSWLLNFILLLSEFVVGTLHLIIKSNPTAKETWSQKMYSRYKKNTGCEQVSISAVHLWSISWDGYQIWIGPVCRRSVRAQHMQCVGEVFLSVPPQQRLRSS